MFRSVAFNLKNHRLKDGLDLVLSIGSTRVSSRIETLVLVLSTDNETEEGQDGRWKGKKLVATQCDRLTSEMMPLELAPPVAGN